MWYTKTQADKTLIRINTIYMGVYMHIYTHINTLDFILCLIHEKILDAINEHSFIK